MANIGREIEFEEYEREFIFEGRSDELTDKDIIDFINKHMELKKRLIELEQLYKSNHPILRQGRNNKGGYKPDNRLVVNFPKYIVDTLNGFLMGIPVKTSHENENISNVIAEIENRNNLDDLNFELSKKMSIFGFCYELHFLDDDSKNGVVIFSPLEGFIIKDNSLRSRKLRGIRYGVNSDNIISGTISDDTHVYDFIVDEDTLIVDYENGKEHYFGEVPIIEYVENEEYQSAYEPVETLINAYNKAISEKMNDVDYFGDAYMKILGAKLEQKNIEQIKDNRVINLPGYEGKDITVEFMGKPNADGMQENLVNRLERLIFTISMVSNVSDESFATSSGIALKYKLLSMLNLSNTKESKLKKGFYNRWRLISRNILVDIPEEETKNIRFKFYRNLPANLIDEANVANLLNGIVSDRTILESLSLVDDVSTEISRIEGQSESLFEVENTSLHQSVDEKATKISESVIAQNPYVIQNEIAKKGDELL